MPLSTPIYRDLLAYQRLTIDQASTRQVAQELDISQTRVRQVVRRVTDWIAEHAPPTSETDDAKKLRLAQQIAADRLEHCLQQANAAWQKSHEVKYLSLLSRLIVAQSKIPALPGTIEALLTDAILGPLENTVANPIIESQTTNDGPQSSEAIEQEPESTPSSRSILQFEICNLKSEISPPSPSSFIPPPSSFPTAPPPPPRDCSPLPSRSPPARRLAPPPSAANPTEQEPSDDDDSQHRAARSAFFAPAHLPDPASDLSPITELKITPQKLTAHSGQKLNRHQRRRLQRLTAKP